MSGATETLHAACVHLPQQRARPHAGLDATPNAQRCDVLALVYLHRSAHEHALTCWSRIAPGLAVSAAAPAHSDLQEASLATFFCNLRLPRTAHIYWLENLVSKVTVL